MTGVSLTDFYHLSGKGVGGSVAGRRAVDSHAPPGQLVFPFPWDADPWSRSQAHSIQFPTTNERMRE